MKPVRWKTLYKKDLYGFPLVFFTVYYPSHDDDDESPLCPGICSIYFFLLLHSSFMTSSTNASFVSCSIHVVPFILLHSHISVASSLSFLYLPIGPIILLYYRLRQMFVFVLSTYHAKNTFCQCQYSGNYQGLTSKRLLSMAKFHLITDFHFVIRYLGFMFHNRKPE